MKMEINGYTISGNDIFGGYDVTHPEIGQCGYFDSVADAMEYCEKG